MDDDGLPILDCHQHFILITMCSRRSAPEQSNLDETSRARGDISLRCRYGMLGKLSNY
jgi:hypothetical protein